MPAAATMRASAGWAAAGRRVGIAPTLRRGVMLAAAALACDGSARPPGPTDRLAAEQFIAESRRERLALNLGAARDAALAALAADPLDVRGVLTLMDAEIGDWSVRSIRTLDSIATVLAGAGDEALAVCYRRLANAHRGTMLPPIPPGPPSPPARLCIEALRAEIALPPLPPERAAALAAMMLTQLPDEAPAILGAVAPLQNSARWDDVIRIGQRLIAPGRTAIMRAKAFGWIATAEHERGNDEAAVAAERMARLDPDWALPGFRTSFAAQLAAHDFLRALGQRPDPTPLALHSDSIRVAIEQLFDSSRAIGDTWSRYQMAFTLGVARLDRGRLEEAVRDLTVAVALADTLGEPYFRAAARMRLGRALVKRGRHADAERELRAAQRVADSLQFPNVQKEVEHNLLHLYEGLGRWADAETAGEAFVRYAAMGGLNPVRMMSVRDLAMYHRARGNVAASQRLFERMLVDIDSLRRERYYAGEYYELTGNLDSARTYYERALHAADEPGRSLEGLVRVSLAVGDTAAARHWAAVHDARRDAAGRPESAPLLPIVLLRAGSVPDARAAFVEARDETSRHGQVAGWAALTADLAELELRARAFGAARQLADSAAIAARSVGVPETALRAEAVAALATVHASPNAAGPALRTLERAAGTASRTASPQVRADVALMLGDALDAAGRWREALAWYARAAAPLDSVAAQIALDPRQAAYRSAQRRVYDHALAAIARHGTHPAAAQAFADWSARRKGRAFGVPVGAAATARIALPPRGSAVVDYALLDSTIAALVVTPAGARVVTLPGRSGGVRADVMRLRSATDARVGSNVDVNRARFPADVAHRLYLALVQPLEPLLRDARTLTVVPDGALNLLPFDALVTQVGDPAADERRAAFLVDRFTIVTAVTSRGGAAPMRFAAGRVLAVAPPRAPGGDAEVEAIARVVARDRLSVLAGAAATRAATLRAMGDAAVIHFAAHAEANEHDPGASLIALAPDGTDDAALRAAEVGGASLAGQLVILSACETAGGRILEGEGVLSLSRSFLRAGARATVATLWSVGPHTADFAAALHERLARGLEVAQAVRDAKLAMRKSGAPVFAWAPYQLFVAPPAARPTAARAAATRIQ